MRESIRRKALWANTMKIVVEAADPMSMGARVGAVICNHTFRIQTQPAISTRCIFNLSLPLSSSTTGGGGVVVVLFLEMTSSWSSPPDEKEEFLSSRFLMMVLLLKPWLIWVVLV
ncbi:hypothetical protein L6452_24938 [Arctium lappa]|uniref:Uncharacterized protein n=1 Tax=Arctium lappa TaxID=4217 RepID=A0ACB9ABB2_ARCLA|nr:hypothetical protein L6452_24938 [Arctium lappa]